MSTKALIVWIWRSIRGSGWFGRNAAGVLPVPRRWQGWLTAIGLILLLMMTASMPRALAIALRLVIIVAYIALGILTYDD